MQNRRKNRKKLRRRRAIWITLLVVSLLLGTAYLLANRYLIEHVNIQDAAAYESSVLAANNASESSQVVSALSSDTAAEETSSYDAASGTYTSDSAVITVTKVTEGTGDDTVTYYVADVTIKDVSSLRTGFAKNQFGTNIIENTSVIAEENSAVFAINGDYYGFRENGIEIRNGVIYRDEPARSGLAIYKDGTMRVYDETTTSAEELLEDGVWSTLSFGPALLEDGEIPSGIDSVEVDTNVGNHSIQGNQPRTGIGMISANHFIFIVADGRSAGYSRGVTLPAFAALFEKYGCTDAYNLDGGGSSTMYFLGNVVNNPLGKGKERGVSDILYIA